MFTPRSFSFNAFLHKLEDRKSEIEDVNKGLSIKLNMTKNKEESNITV